MMMVAAPRAAGLLVWQPGRTVTARTGLGRPGAPRRGWLVAAGLRQQEEASMQLAAGKTAGQLVPERIDLTAAAQLGVRRTETQSVAQLRLVQGHTHSRPWAAVAPGAVQPKVRSHGEGQPGLPLVAEEEVSAWHEVEPHKDSEAVVAPQSRAGQGMAL